MVHRTAAILLIGMAALISCSSPPFIEVPNPIIGSISTVLPGQDTFVLSTDAGERYLFRNAQPDDPGMGQSHLRQHMVDRIQVKITWRRDGYELVAVKIEDGPPRPTPDAGSPPDGSPF